MRQEKSQEGPKEIQQQNMIESPDLIKKLLEQTKADNVPTYTRTILKNEKDINNHFKKRYHKLGNKKKAIIKNTKSLSRPILKLFKKNFKKEASICHNSIQNQSKENFIQKIEQDLEKIAEENKNEAEHNFEKRLQEYNQRQKANQLKKNQETGEVQKKPQYQSKTANCQTLKQSFKIDLNKEESQQKKKYLSCKIMSRIIQNEALDYIFNSKMFTYQLSTLFYILLYKSRLMSPQLVARIQAEQPEIKIKNQEEKSTKKKKKYIKKKTYIKRGKKSTYIKRGKKQISQKLDQQL